MHKSPSHLLLCKKSYHIFQSLKFDCIDFIQEAKNVSPSTVNSKTIKNRKRRIERISVILDF